MPVPPGRRRKGSGSSSVPGSGTTPGVPEYAIGSPVFPEAVVHLPGGKTFEIIARGVSEDNKYIQSATLDGKPLTRPFLSHEELMRGGRLVFEMGNEPDKTWGI